MTDVEIAKLINAQPDLECRSHTYFPSLLHVPSEEMGHKIVGFLEESGYRAKVSKAMGYAFMVTVSEKA